MRKLTKKQIAVLIYKKTEPKGYSKKTPHGLEFKLNKKYGTTLPKKGVFTCVGCGTALYKAETKFDSKHGWPSFYKSIKNKVKEVPDADGKRTEIICSNCGSHLGHIFKKEGFPTPTNERHCVNSISLKYRPEKKKKKKKKTRGGTLVRTRRRSRA